MTHITSPWLEAVRLTLEISMPQAPRRVAVNAPERRRRNSDFAWDAFDPAWYHERNYGHLRMDDRDIIEHVRDFFAHAFKRGRLGAGLCGVDVGAGANLYPSLLMLPFCSSIELRDYSESNIEWLRQQVLHYGPSWDAFWKALVERDCYHQVKNPRARLADVARVELDSVFNLPNGRWDIGTMFFVAESLTTYSHEFQTAVRRFVLALKPRAPFAAAFMRDSEGYLVGDQWFPAVAINEGDVSDCLGSITTGLDLHEVEFGDRLRPGYGGMILATGYRSKQ